MLARWRGRWAVSQKHKLIQCMYTATNKRSILTAHLMHQKGTFPSCKTVTSKKHISYKWTSTNKSHQNNVSRQFSEPEDHWFTVSTLCDSLCCVLGPRLACSLVPVPVRYRGYRGTQKANEERKAWMPQAVKIGGECPLPRGSTLWERRGFLPHVFGGGGGILRCLNPIWSYTYCFAYMHFQNSQGGRSWKAPFSTVARVASRRNHVHCHVHQDTHSCPLHTLQRKEKQIKVCNDWVTKSKTEKK